MNQNDLYESIGQTDEELLARSEKKTVHRRPRWEAAVAVALAVAVIGGAVLWPSGTPVAPAVHALCEVEYPETVSGSEGREL